MKFTSTLAACAAATLAALASAGASAAPTWITVGERAYALLKQQGAPMKTLASQAVGINKPAARNSSTLVRGSEVVYAVEIEEDLLPELTEAVHEKLQRCGGFVRHASQPEALATLVRLNAPPADAVVTPSYAIDDQAQVQALLPQLQASNILSQINTMAAFQNRRYNSSHGRAASDALFNTWAQLNAGNRRGVYVSQISHTGFGQKSVMFEMYGSVNPREVVVLGAHLDSITGGNAETGRAPGADDDASGVASLTEIIRVLMASNYQPQRTLRFIAYAGEEAGLLGSRQIVASTRNLRSTSVVGVVQLDMVAYPGDVTDLWIYTDYTNAAQNQFLANLAATYLPQLTVGYDVCGYGCSDHASWTAAGYAASLPFESSDANYNRTLHTPNDTIATFGSQADHALKFAQLTLAFAVELGSDANPLPGASGAPAAARAAAALPAAKR